VQYDDLDFAASMIFFLLLFAFLELNILLRCLQSSVAIWFLFPTNSLGAWIEAVCTCSLWLHRCADEFSKKTIGATLWTGVLFFISKCIFLIGCCETALENPGNIRPLSFV
jgi:hypothetical protein